MRSCVWSRHGGKRGIHLLKWETLIKPKEKGSANLRPAREMNWSLLAKLAWRLLTSEGSVWGEVVIAKYGLKKEDEAYLRDRQRASQIWKGAFWGQNY